MHLRIYFYSFKPVSRWLRWSLEAFYVTVSLCLQCWTANPLFPSFFCFIFFPQLVCMFTRVGTVGYPRVDRHSHWFASWHTCSSSSNHLLDILKDRLIHPPFDRLLRQCMRYRIQTHTCSWLCVRTGAYLCSHRSRGLSGVSVSLGSGNELTWKPASFWEKRICLPALHQKRCGPPRQSTKYNSVCLIQPRIPTSLLHGTQTMRLWRGSFGWALCPNSSVYCNIITHTCTNSIRNKFIVVLAHFLFVCLSFSITLIPSDLC